MVIRRKVVAVGDYCGKTFVIQTFIKDEVPKPQLTFVSWDTTDVEANGTLVELQVWDTCSKESFEEPRIGAYRRADVFLIFFSIYGRKTFENVEKQWVPEVRKHGPKNVPIVLVGTHCKQLSVRQEPVISTEEAEIMALKVGAVEYVECAAENKFNIEKVFVRAAAATI